MGLVLLFAIFGGELADGLSFNVVVERLGVSEH